MLKEMLQLMRVTSNLSTVEKDYGHRLGKTTETEKIIASTVLDDKMVV